MTDSYQYKSEKVVIHMSDFITNALDTVINPIITVISKVIALLISTRWSAILVWVLLVNAVGFVLMRQDKKFAKEEKRRISENTLMITAAAGGSLGIYLGMYKFNHKTLHKKFTTGVPIIMLIQVAFIAYGLFTLIL